MEEDGVGVLWVTAASTLRWGCFYVSQSLEPTVSLTGVRRPPIMGA